MSPAMVDRRGPVEPGRVDGHDEHRQALVLRGGRVGAGGQPDVVGVLDGAREDLLAVDHVLVPVAHGPRPQRRQVGAGRGLGVADGEVDLAAEDAGEDPLLLLVGAEGHQGRADAVQGEQGQRHARPVRLLDEDHLVDRAPGLTAVLDGPPEAQPPVVAHAADVAGVGRLVEGRALDLCHQVLEVRPELTLEVPLLCRELQVHRGPPVRSRAGRWSALWPDGPPTSAEAAPTRRRGPVGVRDGAESDPW